MLENPSNSAGEKCEKRENVMGIEGQVARYRVVLQIYLRQDLHL
jgi:hypothetical protein